MDRTTSDFSVEQRGFLEEMYRNAKFGIELTRCV